MLDIVLVNWNSRGQLSDAIASIVQHHGGLVKSVIIVDNASSDDSLSLAKVVASNSPFDVKVIVNTWNRGFGAACNQGAALAEGEFVLFLNPDARIFSESLLRPLTYLKEPGAADVGIVGVSLVDEKNKVARSCSRFPTVASFFVNATGLNRLPGLQRWTQAMVEWPHDSNRQVDQVIGAFFLMRRDLFVALHGFDERFFVYFEEVDLSLRARQAGFRSMYIADVQAYHAGGGTSQQVKGHRLFYSLRSRLLYGFKHFKRMPAWTLVFVTLCLEPLSRIGSSLIAGRIDDARNTLMAYRMLIADLGDILMRASRP